MKLSTLGRKEGKGKGRKERKEGKRQRRKVGRMKG